MIFWGGWGRWVGGVEKMDGRGMGGEGMGREWKECWEGGEHGRGGGEGMKGTGEKWRDEDEVS
jgi:hypothetical protein